MCVLHYWVWIWRPSMRAWPSPRMARSEGHRRSRSRYNPSATPPPGWWRLAPLTPSPSGRCSPGSRRRSRSTLAALARFSLPSSRRWLVMVPTRLCLRFASVAPRANIATPSLWSARTAKPASTARRRASANVRLALMEPCAPRATGQATRMPLRGITSCPWERISRLCRATPRSCALGSAPTLAWARIRVSSARSACPALPLQGLAPPGKDAARARAPLGTRLPSF
mmetsp:Transcript_49379/g.105574  ORF Transcript_49379/g.105574 Transcript_49379/m.105574 type:complete len:227 (-) Transcript_49379:294-974(-)